MGMILKQSRPQENAGKPIKKKVTPSHTGNKANKDGNSLIPGQPVIKTEFVKTDEKVQKEDKPAKSEVKKVPTNKRVQEKKLVKRIKVIKPERAKKTKAK